MKQRVIGACLIAVAAMFLLGCATGRSAYVDPSVVDEKGSQFGDTDMKLMSEEMVTQLLQAPFIERVEKPASISIVGIKNETSEFINTDEIADKIMVALLNNGSQTFEFVDRSMLEETMNEFDLGSGGIVSTEEATKLGRAAGVDFLMTGTLSSITKVDRREDQRFYRLSVRLVDVERNTVAWVSEKEIRKVAKKGVLKW